MNNQTFSSIDVVAEGLKTAWRCRWTIFKLILSLLGFFLVITCSVALILGVVDYFSSFFIARWVFTKLSFLWWTRFSFILPRAIFSSLVVYGGIGALVALPIMGFLSKYWSKKLFIINANKGSVALTEVLSGFRGLWSVVWAGLLLIIMILLVGIFLWYLVAMPLYGLTYLIGLDFIIMPAVYVGLVLLVGIFILKMSYFDCFAIDKGLSAMRSLSASYAMTTGYWFRIVLYCLWYAIIFRGLGSFVTTTTEYWIILAIAALPYFVFFLVVKFAGNASDVYAYKILSQEYEKKEQALAAQQQENNTLGN